MLTINEVVEVSISRANRWHGSMEEWSALEWAGAMCGEAGETANAAKKLKRLEDGIPSVNETGRHFDTLSAAQLQVLNEVCDTILYAVLVAARVGFNGEQISTQLAHVFNLKSEEYGFPERLDASSEN